MKPYSPKIVMLAIVVSAAVVGSLAMAAPKNNRVQGSKHDFSVTGTGSTNAPEGTLNNQICIYCHTPHNAGQTRLLWNKAGNGNGGAASPFKMYTASATLSNTVKNSKLDENSPSIFCLTCHDGKTAMNVLHTSGVGSFARDVGGLSGYPADARLAYGTTANVMPGYMFDDPNKLAVGYNNDLTNDHPIGFSYIDVLAELDHAVGLWSFDQVIANSSGKIKFYGTKKKVECSTCHDPHVDVTDTDREKFLVMSNSGSAICLACHNK